MQRRGLGAMTRWRGGGCLGRLAALYLAAFVFTGGGCATRHARRAGDYACHPRVYPATRYAANGKVVGHALHAVGFEYSSGWLFPDNLMQGLLLGCTFYAYSLAVEVPLSLVTDTVLLPYDFYRIRGFKGGDDAFRAALLGDAWPTAPDVLRQQHVPLSSDRVIKAFVEEPDTPDTHAKLRALIDAGLGLELVVKSSRLDVELACRLLERSASFGLAWPEQTVDPDLSRADSYRSGQRAGRAYDQAPDYRNLAFADFLRQQLIRNPALPPDALVLVVSTAAEEARDPLLTLLSETAYPADTFETLVRAGGAGIRRAVAANANTPPAALACLADMASEDPDLGVLVARNPQAGADTLERFSRSGDRGMRLALAQNPALSAPLLARLADGAGTDVPLAVEIARHRHADPETIDRLVGLGLAEVGEVVAGRIPAPPELLDRLSHLANTNSAAALRLGREIARRDDAPPEALDRLARIADLGIRTAVASHRATRAETLDFVAGLARDDWMYGSLVACNPNAAAPTLRRLGGMGVREIDEQVARHPATPPDTLDLLARQALAVLSRPVSGETYAAALIAERVARHHRLADGGRHALTEAVCRLPDPADQIRLLGAILDNPGAGTAEIGAILEHLVRLERGGLVDKRQRPRLGELMRTAEGRLEQ